MKRERLLQLLNLSRNLVVEMQRAKLEFDAERSPKASTLADAAVHNTSCFHKSLVELQKELGWEEKQ